LPRLLAAMGVIAGAVAVARLAVYGSETALSASPLRGYVLFSAFTGGVALAFSRPFLVVLVAYLTVLFGGLKKEGPAAYGPWLGATGVVPRRLCPRLRGYHQRGPEDRCHPDLSVGVAY
jgi:hypothetical protein